MPDNNEHRMARDVRMLNNYHVRQPAIIGVIIIAAIAVMGLAAVCETIGALLVDLGLGQ